MGNQGEMELLLDRTLDSALSGLWDFAGPRTIAVRLLTCACMLPQKAIASLVAHRREDN